MDDKDKKVEIVLTVDSLFLLCKRLREYRRLAKVNDDNAFELMRLKMEEGILQSIIDKGDLFPSMEIDRINGLARNLELRAEVVLHLQEEEELCLCGHDFESHSTSDGGQSEHCDSCDCTEFREKEQ
jgi:hypothetical protein